MTQDDYSDPVLERSVLAALLQDQETAMQYLPQLLPKHFSDLTLRRLLALISGLVFSSGTVPTRETLRVELIGRFPGAEDVIKGLLGIYDQLMALPVDASVSFLMHKLLNFARVREALSSVEQFVRRLEGGDVEAALRQYQDDALALQAADPTMRVVRGEVIEDFEKRRQLIADMAMHPDKYRGILTGIDVLDQVTRGLWKGELGFVFGKTGVGKSYLLLEFAFYAYRSGYKVLVVPIEMPLLQWERRFDARISHIAYEHFKWGTLNESEIVQWGERINTMRERYSAQGGAIYGAHIPMGCTLGAVRAELEKLIQQGTPADLLVVDYADLIAPPRQLYSEQGELTAIFRELKGMAGAYNIPIWTATQSTKVSYRSAHLTMSDVGYAMGKVHVSDLVIGIARSDEDSLSNRMTLSIAKYRDGAYNKPIVLNTNLALAMVNAQGV